MSLEPQNLSLIALKVELKKKGLDVAGTREDLVSRLAAVLPPPAAPPAAPLPAPAAPTSSPTAASSGVEAHPSNPQFVAGRDPSDPSLVPFKPGATASDPRKEEIKKEEKRETAGDSKGSDSEGHRKMLKDNPDKIHTGVCRWYIPKRGYGFITPSEGDPSDLFCHQSEIYSNEFRALEPGEPVEFKLALATNGKVVAVSVTGPSGQPVRSGSRPPDYYHQIPDEEEERFRREEFLYGRRRRREDSYDEYYGYPRGGSAPGPGGYRTIHVADGARMDLPRPMSEEEKEVYKKAGPNMTETDDRPICKGKVKTFNTRKGFGFIIQDDDKTKELFVHETQIHAAGLRTLVEGESVEYRLGDGEKGKVAQRVTGPNGAVVSTNEPLQLPSEWTGPKGKERERRDRWERRDGRDRRRKRDGAERKDATEDKEKGKTYYCAICAVSLSGDQPLADHNKGKKHMRLTMAAKQSGGEIYRCVDCNKSFSNRGDMQRHMEGKHPGVTAQEVVSAVSESQQSSAPSDPSKPTTIPSVGFTQIETTVQSSVGPQARQSESSKKKKKKKKQRLVGASVNFVASSENGGTSGTVTSTTTTTTTPTTLSPAAVKMVLDNTPLKPEEMKCEICNVPFTGRLQREQHLKGRKHQSKVNGAPPPTPGGGWRGKRKYGAPGPTSPAPYYPPAGAYNPYPSSAYYKPYPAYYAPYPPTGPASSPPPTSVPPAPAAGSVPSTINYPYPPYSSYPPSSYSPYPMTTGGGSAPST